MNFLPPRLKYAIYMLCAAFFVIIEHIHNVTNADGWTVSNNYTGIVIFILILLNTNLREGRIRVYIAETIACFAAVAGIIVYGNLNPGTYYTAFVVSVALNVWWILLIATHFLCLFIRRKRAGGLRLIRKPNGLMIAELSFCVLSAIWVIIGNNGYFWPVWFFLMFGLFYLTEITKEEMERLTDGLATGAVWSFLLLEFGFMPFRPYDVVRYVGFFNNSNCFAIFLMVILVLDFVKLFGLIRKIGARRNTVRMVFYSVVACFINVLIFMTGCRTVWVIDFIVTALYFIGILIVKCRIPAKKILPILAGGILCTVMLVYPTYFVIRYVPTIHPHPIWFEGEYSEGKVHSWDPRDSEKYISFEEMMENNLGRLGEVLSFADAANPLKLVSHAETTEHEDIKNSYIVYSSSLPESINIRLNYYKAYAEKLNLFGNASSRYTFYEVYEDGTEYQVYHSQNMWLQLMYQFGVPFGVMMFIVFIIQFVKAVRLLIKGKNAYELLPALIYIVYFIYGLVEVTWLPGHILLTMFFLVQHPDFSSQAGKENKTN